MAQGPENDRPLYGNVYGGTQKYRTADGIGYDVMRGTPRDAALGRGDTLTQMRELVAAREFPLLQKLQTRGATSYEYMSSSAIAHAESRGVKADLLRLVVQQHLSEGHVSSAVRMLAYANAAELDVPELDEDFVRIQFHVALGQNHPRQARLIASQMQRERDITINTAVATEEALAVAKTEWDAKERFAFAAEIRQALTETQVPEIQGDWFFRGNLSQLMQHTVGRQDELGIESENQSPLVMRLARALVQADLSAGQPYAALEDARESGLPHEEIEAIRRAHFPTRREQFHDAFVKRVPKAEVLFRKSPAPRQN